MHIQFFFFSHLIRIPWRQRLKTWFGVKSVNVKAKLNNLLKRSWSSQTFDTPDCVKIPIPSFCLLLRPRKLINECQWKTKKKTLCWSNRKICIFSIVSLFFVRLFKHCANFSPRGFQLLFKDYLQTQRGNLESDLCLFIFRGNLLRAVVIASRTYNCFDC